MFVVFSGLFWETCEVLTMMGVGWRWGLVAGEGLRPLPYGVFGGLGFAMVMKET